MLNSRSLLAEPQQLTLVLQWSASRFASPVSSEMAQRGHIREVLDEADIEE